MKTKAIRCLLTLITLCLMLQMHSHAQVDFRKETIYFLITTRFFDGDASNNRPNEWCSYGPNSPAITDPNDVTWRGDFKGLIQKLDYIKDLGFTAIWITPIVQNRGPLDYHGYHAWDFTKVDPRLESPGATFQDLINEVHARGMKIVLDVVTNHSGRFGIKGKAEMKYNTDPSAAWYAPDNPNWQYDGLTPNPQDGKIWSRANLAKLPAPYNSNLQNFNWPCTESFVNTSDANWFHHSGNGFAQGWDDTENLYNRALAGDCPDLNTGSQAVRDYLVAAYTTFINMGVDGFRWDTMKHMDKTDALYFLDKFKAVNPNLFVFAEVAQKRHELHQVEQINPHWYTWRGAVGSSANSGMAVIDFYAEATFHNVFEDGGSFNNVKSAARFDHLYSDPSTLITWLDNHDFGPNNDWNRRYGGTPENLAACMNFMFTWRGIPSVYYGTEVQFKRGEYADIHDASGISQSLNLTGRAYYGGEFANAPNHKIYQHIKKLNAMRKAIPALQNGTWQWAGGDPSNGVGYIRKSGSSEVAVGLAKDGDVTFNFTGLTNGTYRDAVTGRTASVTNGTLSFAVKASSAGIYVLNGPGMIGGNGVGYFEPGVDQGAPVVSIGTPSGNFPQAIQVSLSATGTSTPIRIYYTTNNTTPTAASTLYSGPITISGNTTLKAIAIDGQSRQSTVETATYTIGDQPGITVNFKKPSDWGTNVRIYYWNLTPANAMPAATWPGVSMTYNETTQWYSYKLTNVTSASMVFNDGTKQTGDLSRSSDGWYKNGVWYNTNPDVVNATPVLTVNPAGPYTSATSFNVTLSATDDSGTVPVIYYTVDGSTPSTSSPSASGTKTLQVTTNTTLKAYAVDNLNASSAVQTHTYTISTTTPITVYFKKPSSWTTPVKIHYWNAQPSGSVASTTWPGVDMAADGGDWYKYTFPAAVTNISLVINANGSTANKTPDLTRNKTGWYDNGNWFDTDPRNVTGLRIHLKTTWTNPKIYFWNATPGTSTTTWPGVSMTNEGNGWYVYTIAGANCSNIIFSNNGASQTADLNRCGEGWYDNGTWTGAAPTARVRTELQEEALNEDIPHSFMLEHYPNPASGTTTISFALTEDSYVVLAVYNDQGKRVMELLSDWVDAGNHKVEVSTGALHAGLYVYRLTAGKISRTKKLIVK